MRVQGRDTQDVGLLIWAATFAWALEATPCRSPGCWRFAMTPVSTGAWSATSSGLAFGPNGSSVQPRGICRAA